MSLKQKKLQFKKHFNDILVNYYSKINKEIRPQTLAVYISRFSVLYKMFDKMSEYTSKPIWLNDYENVIKKIENKYKSLSSVNTTLSAILILIQALNFEEKIVLKYRERLFSNAKQKNVEKKEKLETPTELKITKKLITKIKAKFDRGMKKINAKNKYTLDDVLFIQKYVIFYLFGDKQKPTRVDYANMKKVDSNSKTYDKRYNYFFGDNFYFLSYKTSFTYGRVVLPINKKLLTIINKYKSVIGNNMWLFVNPRSGNKYSDNQFGKMITASFDGKGGVTEIRKYTLSNQFQELFKINQELLQTSKEMLNSPDVIRNEYLQLLSEPVAKIKVKIKNKQ
jgi:hypothetical protein